MREQTYYVTWQDDEDGKWYCADLYSGCDGASIGKAWEDADYAGPFKTSTQALKAVRHAPTSSEKIIQRWRDFFAQGASTIDADEVIQADCDANSRYWIGGPVEGFFPERVEEFVAISDRLCFLYHTDREEWERTYNAAPAPFRLGCDFGEASSLLATESSCSDTQRWALDTMRAVFKKIEEFTEDDLTASGDDVR